MKNRIDMKYSFVIPYYDRLDQFAQTLRTFHEFYSVRTDWELVVVDDSKSTPVMTKHLFILLDSYPDFNVNYVRSMASGAWNPSTAFNEGVQASNGGILILTNPECKHSCDILSELDKEFSESINTYVICACMSLKKDGSFHMWYQHSKERNEKYHFCSAISKENYYRAGGFNDAYTSGYGYDDNSFRDRVLRLNGPVSVRDDLVVIHQWHPKVRPADYRRLLDRNRKIYNQEREQLGV